MIEKKSFRASFFRMLNAAVLCLFALTVLFPFYYVLVLSFNEGTDTLRGGVMLFPRVFTLDNYKKAFEYSVIANSLWISFSRTAIVLICKLFLTSLLAYALTFKTLPGRMGISFFFYFTTLFGGGLVPTYILYREMKILSTYWVLILPSLYSVWDAFIMRTFFSNLPDSIPESARIDGASELTIFFRLVLPLSMPVMATIALYTGVSTWNDWFTGQYFILMKQNLLPAATVLNKLLAQANLKNEAEQLAGLGRMVASGANDTSKVVSTTTGESLRMAFLIIIIFPVMCIYPFLQKYFVKGALIGSVKG